MYSSLAWGPQGEFDKRQTPSPMLSARKARRLPDSSPGNWGIFVSLIVQRGVWLGQAQHEKKLCVCLTQLLSSTTRHRGMQVSAALSRASYVHKIMAQN